MLAMLYREMKRASHTQIRDIALPLTAHSYKLPSASEMARFDSFTIATQVPSQELMERAGKAVFEVIKERFSKVLKHKGGVTILCGSGNNGGDGLVVARHLKKAGAKVQVVLVESERYSTDLKVQIERFSKVKGKILKYPGIELAKLIGASQLIVDAMLGTGQRDGPRGALREMILAANEGEAPVLAIDTPSGLNTDTGEVYAPCVKADLTVSIELVKRGLTQYPARELSGEIIAQPIGIDCTAPTEYEFILYPTTDFRRHPAAHKGSFGHVFVLAGSRNMPGAAKLSALAAARTGAGLVTQAVLSPHGLNVPEVLLAVFNGEFFDEEMFQAIEATLKDASALILGPGLGLHKGTAGLVRKLIDIVNQVGFPALIDADALTILSSLKDKPQIPRAVLTPHPGEAGRLLGCSTADVQRDRFAAAREISSRYGCTTVLKGAPTVLYFGDKGAVNTTGNPYMGTGGSGDVLSGIIGAFLAQGQSPRDAATNGVFIHGFAGDLAVTRRKGPIIATDIIECIGEAIGVPS